jgi:hypothetical protein
VAAPIVSVPPVSSTTSMPAPVLIRFSVGAQAQRLGGGPGRLRCNDNGSNNIDEAEAVFELLASCTICGTGRAGRHLGLGPPECPGCRFASRNDGALGTRPTPLQRPAFPN